MTKLVKEELLNEVYDLVLSVDIKDEERQAHEPARFAPLRQHARMRQLPHDARRKHELLRPVPPI